MKYHISKNGEPAICTAEIKCRLAEESDHFETYEAAYEASVARLSEEYGEFATYKPYSNPEAELEAKFDKIWESPHTHVKDAEEVRKTPIWLIDTETADTTEITRISSAKGVFTFWDKEGNEVKNVNALDNVAYSDFPLNEILDK